MPAEASTRRASQVSDFLAKRVAAGDFPSAVYLISQGAEIVFCDSLGFAVVEPYRIAASLGTIYDLASVTKPLVTGLLCAKRIALGELTIDSSVSHYLPEFDRTDRHMITVRQLLTHTSGLPAWRPLYILAEDEPDRAMGVIANEPLEYYPGTQVIYSDLGFVVLGMLLQRITGKPLATLFEEEIIRPLKLEHTYFNPEIALQTGIAACESGNNYEIETCKSSGLEDYKNWRENLIWGEVHDGNAHFLGGSAGHAGLFATASDTARIARQFLPDQSELLNAETCELFQTNMTPGLEEERSIAWQLASTVGSSAGPALPQNSFGHTGFTGVSCWVTPKQEWIFVLLTNRTHAHALPFANINSVRREFHSLAVEALSV